MQGIKETFRLRFKKKSKRKKKQRAKQNLKQKKENKKVLPISIRKRFLVYGYIRHIQNQILSLHIIPLEIYNIVADFYGKNYNFYGIGWNGNGELGVTGSPIKQYTELTELNNQCCDINDIYLHFGTILIKNTFNEIYDSYKKKIVKTRHDKSNEFITLINYGKTAENHFYMTTNINNKNNDFYGYGTDLKLCTKLDIWNDIFDKVNLIKISSGSTHTVFLSDIGKLWSCGRNNWGQCCIDTSETSQVRFITSVDTKAVIVKDILCGLTHTLCISNMNILHGFGSNTYGELGITRAIRYRDYFSVITRLCNDKISVIDCGHNNSLCIGDNGQCWTFGRDYSGRAPSELHLLQELLGFENTIIVDGSIGVNHTILLTDKNNIVSFGINKDAQCSVLSDLKRISDPHILKKHEIGIDENEQILKALAGNDITVIVTNSTKFKFV